MTVDMTPGDYKIKDYHWEMKFTLDAAGNVSGGNKNDHNKIGGRKTYSGTIKNGVMDVWAVFESGQKNHYTGTIQNMKFTGEIQVVSGGTGYWKKSNVPVYPQV